GARTGTGRCRCTRSCRVSRLVVADRNGAGGLRRPGEEGEHPGVRQDVVGVAEQRHQLLDRHLVDRLQRSLLAGQRAGGLHQDERVPVQLLDGELAPEPPDVGRLPAGDSEGAELVDSAVSGLVVADAPAALLQHADGGVQDRLRVHTRTSCPYSAASASRRRTSISRSASRAASSTRGSYGSNRASSTASTGATRYRSATRAATRADLR